MSDRQQENALRIADYLGNKLSPEEKEAFKHALGEDDQLRLQYVDALMNRARGSGDAGGSGAADAGHAGMGAASWALAAGETQDPEEKVFDQEMSVPDHGGATGMGGLEESARESVVGGSDVGSDDASGSGATGVDASRDDAHAEPPAGKWQDHADADADKSIIGERKEGAAPAAAGGDEAEENQAPLVTADRWRDGAARVPPEDGGGRFTWLGRRWMVVVAALLIIAGAVVIYVMKGHRGWWTDSETPATTGSGTDAGTDSTTAAASTRTAAGAGSGAARATKAASGSASAGGSGSSAAAGATADSIYDRLYKPYMRGDDPAEVSMYYNDYKEGNYSAVLARGDSVKGAGMRALLVRDYMRLYVGLSYLATDSAREAVTELEGVVLRTKPGDILYENARWYLALAWLKRKDVDASEAVGRALGLAREISQSYSRFRDPARELVKALGS